MTGEATTPVYKEKIKLKIPDGFPLKAYLRFLAKKSRQNVPFFRDDIVLSTIT